MNIIAGWMIMVGLLVAGSHIGDLAEAIKTHQCVSVKEGA